MIAARGAMDDCVSMIPSSAGAPLPPPAPTTRKRTHARRRRAATPAPPPARPVPASKPVLDMRLSEQELRRRLPGATDDEIRRLLDARERAAVYGGGAPAAAGPASTKPDPDWSTYGHHQHRIVLGAAGADGQATVVRPQISHGPRIRQFACTGSNDRPTTVEAMMLQEQAAREQVLARDARYQQSRVAATALFDQFQRTGDPRRGDAVAEPATEDAFPVDAEPPSAPSDRACDDDLADPLAVADNAVPDADVAGGATAANSSSESDGEVPATAPGADSDDETRELTLQMPVSATRAPRGVLAPNARTTVRDLRAMCSRLGLARDGTKPELLRRLRDAAADGIDDPMET